MNPLLPCEVLDTSVLPPSDRFERWYEVIAREAAPTYVKSPHLADFKALAKRVSLGTVLLAELRYPTLDTIRSPRLVRRSQPDTYQLVLMTTGESVAHQERTQSSVPQASFTLLDNSKPFTGTHYASGPTLASSISLVIPHQALPLHPDKVRGLLASSISSDTGMAALLAQFVRRVAARPEEFAPSQAATLGAIALDLAASTLAQRLAVQELLPVEVRERTLRTEIEAFIENNLGRTDLTPRSVAAAHHISLRMLHRLFASEQHTVAELIRHRRLARCQRDLLNPLLADRPVHRIAARWGFPAYAHFSRLFKHTFGMSPQQYRDLHR
ncbi:helix-turn-helix domain-containing protein [Verrucosispora sp. WMMA2121]|uniref:AraC-like ligand-binding domain-containing protein n=1 Tax=Verrucosispora sp. WMMA2121 TaxID=3015164 RepID=UPI0022B644DE|nr:helix-turn-helix domain-containing protein [Verrucosispora sp. WMMA2121]MCZ7421992.1 helix-turn-helix domain-containing protein [Verrucosispora sp. WMMA2121]